MTPRTKNEREVATLSRSLSTRKTDIDWIERRHKVGTTEYFAIFEKKGDWQVIRMFMYRSYSKKNEIFHEPLRYWLKGDGSYVIEAKQRQCLGNYYIDAWIVGSELSIKPNGGSRDVRQLYCNFAKVHSLIPELKRINNFTAKNPLVTGLMPFWLTHSLLTNNRIETFFKLNQKYLAWKFYHYDQLTETLWQSIRVALRHGYHWDEQKEINDWCDMIRDLEYLGLDTRNPHYICPANLDEAHQHYIDKRREQAGLERLMREINEVEAYEPYFAATREQFFDMVLTDKEISVSVIPSAKAIKEEGKKMHHCVGSYYNKEHSLILSAKINGKRVETIEVSLDSYTLVQSRGICNKSTKYHKRIVNLINANLDFIRVLDINHKSIERKKIKELNQIKKAS